MVLDLLNTLHLYSTSLTSVNNIFVFLMVNPPHISMNLLVGVFVNAMACRRTEHAPFANNFVD